MEEVEMDQQFEEPEGPDTDQILMGIMVTLMRIYDVLAAEAMERNPEGAVRRVLEMHERGEINGTEPMWLPK